MANFLSTLTLAKAISIAAGCAAAGLGGWAALLDVPRITTLTADGYLVGSEEFFAALGRQGQLNAYAACCAAVAVLASALA